MLANSLPLAIIADDLTGALDTAAPFASRTLDTWLAPHLDRLSNIVDRGANVVAVSTESRRMPPKRAAQRVAAVIDALQLFRPAIVFKKIDSILRGNVGAEIVGTLCATGRRHAFISPAVPSQNRVMRGGTIYLNGMRLAVGGRGSDGSEMPSSAHLPDLLKEPGELSIHRSAVGHRLTLASTPGLHAYVVDAESDADLDALAQFLIEHPDDVLPVGASGLGQALARAIAISPASDLREPRVDLAAGTLLYVIGSRKQASCEQVSALLRAGAEEIGVPVRDGDEVEALIEARLSELKAPSIIVLRPDSTEATCLSTSEVAERLGRAASFVMRRIGSSAVVMAGGETAAACLAAFNAEWLHVDGELHHGIAFGTMGVGGEVVRFFSKSGSFGSSDTWVRLAEQLQAGPIS